MTTFKISLWPKAVPTNQQPPLLTACSPNVHTEVVRLILQLGGATQESRAPGYLTC